MLSRPQLLNVLGLLLQGDIAGITCYTKILGHKVYFLAAPPKVPASPAQQHQRNRYRNAARVWRSMDPAERDNWRRVALLARLRVTGYDLFIHTTSNIDSGTARTLAARYRIELHRAHGVPI